MVHFEIEELMRLQTRQHNIRNLSVIAHVDHGKSTLTDSLLAGAGMMRMEDAGNRCATDTLEYEKERGITVKSTAVSMMFDLASVPRAALPAEFEGNQCLVNLIDCPGHLDFSSEVTAALRLTDGALVVVDCVDGVCVQTETVLRQALMEGIQPVLVINKMDRAFFQMKFTPEELFLRIRQIIESVNAIISTYSAQVETESEDASGSSAVPLGVRGNLSPDEGTVCFSAGLLGWGFTLPQVARKWYPTVRDQPRLIRRLWGDNWVDPKTNKWSTQEGPGLVRGFCQFVVKPLGQVLAAAQNGDLAALHPLLQRLGSQISMRDLEESYGGSNTKDLIKRAMQSVIPAHEALVEMAACKLPSPVKAQLHRGPMLYTGPVDDETGQAVRNCDVNGPLTIFIAKLVPDPGVKGRFLALGRIFSGSVKSGDKVRILGPNYDPEAQQSSGSSSAAKDEYKGVINRTCVMAAAQPWNVETVGAGNIVALGGVDKFILKTATLVSRDDSFPLKNMKFSVSPIVRQAVSTKDAKHLPQLVTALKKLTKVDPLVQISSSEHGGHVIAGAGELHLELIFLDLQGLLGDGIEIVKSQPVVSYCETVLGESDRVCMAKSANRHNRLYMKAEPMGLEFCSAVQAGTLQTQGGDREALGKELMAKYGWDQNDTKKIWCWGPESASVSAGGGGGSSSSSGGGSSGGGPSNVLVDCTRAVAYMNETRDSLSAAFKWVAGEGVLCGEPLQGVRFNVMDAVLHADVVHRGGGQLIPAARRVLFASQLTAQPRLMEPIYQVDIQGPRSVLGSAYNVLNNRRGQIVDILEAQGGASVGSNNVVTIRAHMPVAESFGFVADLGGATGGQAFPSLAFSHWAVMQEDPLQPGTLPNKIVKEIRERKRMNAGLPSLDDYLDKL